jgi:DNA-binding response OmpR family regulator
MSLEPRVLDEHVNCQPQPPQPIKILVVEDDPSVQKILKRMCEAEGFAVEGSLDGRAGLDSFHADAPSAVILDSNLPKLSGQFLCKEMKTAAPLIPIIILTASSDFDEKIALLEMGVHDYMTKPFSPRELMARLRVALCLSSPPPRSSQVTFDGITVNLEKMIVVRNRTTVYLTAREFKILQFFVQNPDRIIPRSELLNYIWGNQNAETANRSIDNHILKLRRKLENDPGRPIHFRTAHRLGYRFTF